MSIKKFKVTIPAVEETTYEIEASNKNAAANRASRQWREEHKNPVASETVRVGKDFEVNSEEAGEEKTEEVA